MYIRFITLTNELKPLGRIILEEDKVEKILTRVLPVSWESKITAIQESKNFATLRLDELIGNLTAYELRRQTMKMDTPKKERSLALRIAEGSDLEDDEMAMITREFKKHHSSNKRGLGYVTQAPKWDSRSKYLTFPENKIWTHCGKAGHYKNECNAKEKASQKNKVFVQEKNKLPGWVQVKGRSQIWYMDIGCSKHMTGNKDQFLSFEDLKGGNVSFGNGKKGEIIGVGKVGKQILIP
ncbi:uncharacterized protein [Nicotiana sylvestris]|uniref:uncharacterized protein n=1 Tax=Nicotiana sylvestris TaxID=4096 RepID=UPI00388CD779